MCRLSRLYGSDLRWRFLGLCFTPVRDSELYPVVGCDARMMRARMGALAQSVLPRFANVSVIRWIATPLKTICVLTIWSYVAESGRIVEFEADPSFEKTGKTFQPDSRARQPDSERRAGTRRL